MSWSSTSLSVIKKSGLSSVERSAIEQHSEEITMIKDTIVSETSTIQDREERMKASGELWTEYGQFLPEAAMSGLYKMVTTL